MHNSRQWPGARTILVEAIGYEPTHNVEGQRRENDLSHNRPGLSDRVQHQHERMGEAYLVVPVRADQEEVPDFRVGDEMLNQSERGRVQPLQVIEEEGERVLLPGEDGQEGP